MAQENKWKFKGDLEVNSEQLEYWRSELKLAQSVRKKYFYDDENNKGPAIDAINYYLGDQDILKAGLETPIVDNQIAPIVTTFISAITSPKTDILVNLTKQSEIPMQREITQSVFQYFKKELKMDWQNEQVLVDAYITGLGVKTNGYNSEFDTQEITDKVKKKVKKRKGLGRGKGTKMVEEEIEEEIVRRKEWITKEFPFNLRHSPLMTLVDPRAKSNFPYDGKWICLEYEVPYNEVKGNANFENTDDLTPTGNLASDKDKVMADDYKKGMVHLYQIQISKKDGLYILTMAKDYDKPLRYVKYPFEIEGFLTTFLAFNDTIDNFYAPSDVNRLLPLQDEINYIQSKNLEAIYKFLPKIGLNKDLIPDEGEALNALEKGDIGTIIMFQGQATPQQAAQVLNFNLNLQDKLIILQDLRQEMKLLSGVTEAQLTGQTDAKTATEANIGARGASSRIVYRRNRMSRFLAEDLRKFKQIVIQAADFPLITRITGIRERDEVTGELITEKWLRLNSVKEALVGEFELEIDMIPANQPNLELKRRQILETMNFLLSPQVEAKLAREGMKIDTTLGIKEFLRTMDQFREAVSMVVPMPPQEAQELQMQQMAQSGQLDKLAQAPQGPPGAAGPARSEADTIGEIMSGIQGNI